MKNNYKIDALIIIRDVGVSFGYVYGASDNSARGHGMFQRMDNPFLAYFHIQADAEYLIDSEEAIVESLNNKDSFPYKEFNQSDFSDFNELLDKSMVYLKQEAIHQARSWCSNFIPDYL